jgi:hypothetical protein
VEAVPADLECPQEWTSLAALQHGKRNMTDEEWSIRTGAAALAVCLVRTLQESDPTFQDRFLAKLDDAYHHFRDNSTAVRKDGTRRQVTGVLEIISWTNQFLTGWDPISGQGEPLLK